MGGAWADKENQRGLVENLSFSKSKTERGFGLGVPGWGERVNGERAKGLRKVYPFTHFEVNLTL